MNDAKVNRNINWLAISFGFLSVYQVVSQFEFLKFMLTDEYSQFDLETVLIFLPIILPFIATILFWKRKKIGWIAISAFLVFTLVNAIWAFYLALQRRNTSAEYAEVLEEIFPGPNPSLFLISVAILSGTLLFINKGDIRKAFKISFEGSLLTIVLTALITITLLYEIYS